MSTGHKRLSPSGLYRSTVCPGSVEAEAALPDVSNPSSIDGTHSHTVLQHCIVNTIWDARTLMGKSFTDHEGTFVSDVARGMRVNMALDYIKEKLSKVQGLKVVAEKQTNPARWVERDDMGGTLDITLYGAYYKEVIDYKDGIGYVSVQDNLQLIAYALGELNQDEKVWMTIIQPKNVIKGRPPISSTFLTFDELMAKAKFLKERAALTDQPNAPRVAGDHCNFCKAKGPNCSTFWQKSTGIIMNLPAESLTDAAIKKDPGAMTDEQIADALDAAPLLRQFLASLDEEALKRMKSGRQIRGRKLVNGKGSRKWALDEAKMAEALNKLGIPKGQIYTQTLLSPAQAEKLAWKSGKGEEMKSLSKAALEKLKKEYIVSMAGAVTIANAEDDRPAIVTDASGMFGAAASAPAAEPVALPSFMMAAAPAPTAQEVPAFLQVPAFLMPK